MLGNVRHNFKVKVKVMPLANRHLMKSLGFLPGPVFVSKMQTIPERAPEFVEDTIVSSNFGADQDVLYIFLLRGFGSTSLTCSHHERTNQVQVWLETSQKSERPEEKAMYNALLATVKKVISER